MASVVNLFVSAAIGQPMQPQISVRAFAGRGLEGDRYERGEGSYSRLARVAARHVSLIAREAIEAANEELVQRGLIPFEMQERDATSSSKVSMSMDCWARNFASAECGYAAPNRPGHATSRRRPPARPDLRRLITIAAACGPRSSRMELFRLATSFRRTDSPSSYRSAQRTRSKPHHIMSCQYDLGDDERDDAVDMSPIGRWR